jgi:hypothetical protein
MQGNRGKVYNGHWYEQVSELLETSYEGKVTVCWKQLVPTDRNIPNNKTDFIILDIEKKYLSINRNCIIRGLKYDRERSRENSKIKRPKNRSTVRVEYKN